MRVELGRRSYDVLVVDGDLDGLGAAVAAVQAPGRAVLVTNPVVGAHYSAPAAASMARAGFEAVVVEIPDGEAHKTVHTWHTLVEQLLALGVDRQTPLVALGGGVTGDVAGFAAATVLRGLPLVQVPTSLLAMVDSSVGGKTGVNASRGKNLLGAFHQPSLVYVALDTLRTLAPVELRAGLAEVVKHGLVGDPEIFRVCEEQGPRLLGLERGPLREVVEASCRAKAAVVARDEREAGLRVVLNLGHTVGHAIEAASGFGRLRHGECVAIGLVAEARWAAARGACDAALPGRVARVLAGLGLPVRPPPLPEDALLDALSVDKKMTRGTLRTPVLTEIGGVRVDRIDNLELAAMLRALFDPVEIP